MRVWSSDQGAVVDVELLPGNGNPPLVAGESAHGDTVAAIANAVCHVIVVRVRSLPRTRGCQEVLPVRRADLDMLRAAAHRRPCEKTHNHAGTTPASPGYRADDRVITAGTGCGSGGRSSRRLVLGDAVDTAAAFEQRPRVDAHHLPAGVLFGEDGGRVGVVRVVKAARDHPAVDDQVVDVAVVDEPLGVGERGGGGHLDDLP